MADLTIKKNLNIVFSAGDFIVHHTPVGYETYFSVTPILGATFSKMISVGNRFPSTQMQAVVATFLEVSKDMAMMSGLDYDQNNDGFLGEMQSRTTLIKNGKTFNLYDAIADKTVSEKVINLIYAKLIFFIQVSNIQETTTIEEWAAQIGASTTSLTFMEYSNSLTTSTANAVTG
jgi:hypothetical protein